MRRPQAAKAGTMHLSLIPPPSPRSLYQSQGKENRNKQTNKNAKVTRQRGWEELWRSFQNHCHPCRSNGMKLKPYTSKVGTTIPLASPFATRLTLFKHQTSHFDNWRFFIHDCKESVVFLYFLQIQRKIPLGNEQNSPNSSTSRLQTHCPVMPSTPGA